MERIFAIGDVHGCLDKLVKLMDMIQPDLDRDTLVFIGDYIDRGPDSMGVIEYLAGLGEPRSSLVFLKGNHEIMLHDYLEGTNISMFLSNGGRETLESYRRGGYEAHAGILPAGHAEFLGRLRLYHETQDYIFVHAGLRPEVSLSKQTERDLLWIREEFIYSDYNFEKRVVFGHTPFREPVVMDNKIGIDTGAVYGNKLTCVELPAERFFAAR